MYHQNNSDIFGTKNLPKPVRISNNYYVDPNLIFKQKSDWNYHNYQQKLNKELHFDNKKSQKYNFPINVYQQQKEKHQQQQIKLNNKNFEQYDKKKHQTVHPKNYFLQQKNEKQLNQKNFGRKQIIKRQQNSLIHNLRSSSSRIFGNDDDQNGKKYFGRQLSPLIPSQMQWDQHDSIRSNFKTQPENQCFVDSQLIMQSQNQDYYADKAMLKGKLQKNKNTKQTQCQYYAQCSRKEEKKPNKTTNLGCIEIKIMKGWDNKFVEGLGKQCRLNSTVLVKLQIDSEGKGVIILKRSLKWQNIADWFRRQAKLSIRVMNT